MDNLVYFCKECKKKVEEDQVIILCTDITNSEHENYTDIISGGNTIYVICKEHGS